MSGRAGRGNSVKRSFLGPMTTVPSGGGEPQPKRNYKLMHSFEQDDELVAWVTRDGSSQDSLNAHASHSTANRSAPSEMESALLYSESINSLVNGSHQQAGMDLCPDARNISDVHLVTINSTEGEVFSNVAVPGEEGNVCSPANWTRSLRGGIKKEEDTQQHASSPTAVSEYVLMQEGGSDDDSGDDDDYDIDQTYVPPPSHDDLQRRQRALQRTKEPSGSGSFGTAGHVDRRQQMQSQPPNGSTVTQNGAPEPNQSTGRAGQKKSPVWFYFKTCTIDPLIVICNICDARVRRGKFLDKVGTGGLHSHLSNYHKREYSQIKAGQGDHIKGQKWVSVQPHPINCSTESYRSPSATDSATSGQTSASSSFHSTQPLIQQLRWPPKPLPASIRKIQRLNGLLAKAMAQQLLPYSLVEEGSTVRQLLEYAVPEWQIPTRHYFSHTGVPALHRHTVENVTVSLDHSIGNKVHLTMDAWSSSQGQERYLSFTVHWVTMHSEVEGSSPSVVSELLVPPRGVKGSSSAIAYATIAAQNKRPRCTAGVVHRRCRAMLQLVNIKEDGLNGENILAILRQQVQKWLTPRRLQVGHVVCDNSSSLLAALREGNISHVPCIAHVLNMVVQRFLRTYPGLSNVVQLARNVSAHFCHSATSAKSLSALQRRYGLPPNRLIVDSATRWNSTLRMLDRLWEQKRAIAEYILNQDIKGSGLAPIYISEEEWRQIHQVCYVLTSFDQAIGLVSVEQVGVNEVLPILFLLEEALSRMIEAGEDAISNQEQGLQIKLEQEEEDVQQIPDTLEVPDHLEEGEQESVASVVRGWGDPESQQQEDSYVLQESEGDTSARSLLFPMADHMLRCLRSDPHIKRIKDLDYYWLATLLDPRCKGKMSQFIAPSKKEERMLELQQALVRQLLEAFPQPENPANPPHQIQQVAAPRRPSYPGDLFGAIRNFFSSERATTAPAINNQGNDRLVNMVTDYMSSLSASDTMRTEDPMEYWAARLDTCPELAQYAIELLSCPAGSVVSERSFSAAGGVVTEMQSRLPTDSADRLTFLKMNHFWIDGDYIGPVVRDRQ